MLTPKCEHGWTKWLTRQYLKSQLKLKTPAVPSLSHQLMATHQALPFFTLKLSTIDRDELPTTITTTEYQITKLPVASHTGTLFLNTFAILASTFFCFYYSDGQLGITLPLSFFLYLCMLQMTLLEFETINAFEPTFPKSVFYS